MKCVSGCAPIHQMVQSGPFQTPAGGGVPSPPPPNLLLLPCVQPVHLSPVLILQAVHFGPVPSPQPLLQGPELGLLLRLQPQQLPLEAPLQLLLLPLQALPAGSTGGWGKAQGSRGVGVKSRGADMGERRGTLRQGGREDGGGLRVNGWYRGSCRGGREKQTVQRGTVDQMH